jgi:hypothetical protein
VAAVTIPRCWVCGKELGPAYGRFDARGRLRRFTYSLVTDATGIAHRTHHRCAPDGDGRVTGRGLADCLLGDRL